MWLNMLSISLKRINDGFTLIEVLVALLILAVGLLGIAALQFKGMRYSNDAFMRSQITFLAYDIADRIRANAANGAAYTDQNYVVHSILVPMPAFRQLVRMPQMT